jgi:hypothetical protein
MAPVHKYEHCIPDKKNKDPNKHYCNTRYCTGVHIDIGVYNRININYVQTVWYRPHVIILINIDHKNNISHDYLDPTSPYIKEIVYEQPKEFRWFTDQEYETPVDHPIGFEPITKPVCLFIYNRAIYKYDAIPLLKNATPADIQERVIEFINSLPPISVRLPRDFNLLGENTILKTILKAAPSILFEPDFIQSFDAIQFDNINTYEIPVELRTPDKLYIFMEEASDVANTIRSFIINFARAEQHIPLFEKKLLYEIMKYY